MASAVANGKTGQYEAESGAPLATTLRELIEMGAVEVEIEDGVERYRVSECVNGFAG